jgi:hypothetical protein
MSNRYDRFTIIYKGYPVDFYPISNNGGLGETLKYYMYNELPDLVYGKYVTGFAGYTPFWIYDTFRKEDISVMKKIN